MVRWRGCTHHLHIGWVKTPPVRMQHTLPLLVNVQTRGNQREIDRARAQARKDKYSKGGKDDGLTPGQRKERCAGRTLPWIECVFTTGSGLCADPDGVWAVCRRRGGGNNGHAPARSPGPGSGVTPPPIGWVSWQAQVWAATPFFPSLISAVLACSTGMPRRCRRSWPRRLLPMRARNRRRGGGPGPNPGCWSCLAEDCMPLPASLTCSLSVH